MPGLEHYDVVIVGGGIQGCGIAQAAQAAGFSVLLLEQGACGEATSSRSSKLIHGGLRYLQSGQFKLVRECLAEREWMLEHCPDLVKRNWFYIPIYKHSHYKSWQIHCGLWLYYLLSGVKRGGRFRKVPRREWPGFTGLQQQGLQALFAYQDGQTDDLALTLAVQRSAISLGAQCLEQTQFLRAQKRSQGGYEIVFRQNMANKGEQSVYTTMLINVSGPWVNQVLGAIAPPLQPVPVELVQGSHLVVSEKLGDECFYLEAPQDQRAVFVLPWQGKTLIGTTETVYQGDPADTHPLPQERDYLLETVQMYFPGQSLTVCESFSGLRVLPRAAGRSFRRSRDVMLQVNDRVLSIYGGKLTAWRATAEKVLDQIERQLGRRKSVDTRQLPLV